MALVFYYSMAVVSVILAIVFAFIFHKHFDVNLSLITILVPLINVGFIIMGHASVVEEAVAGLKLTYIGGCYMIFFAMLLIFNICGVKIKPWIRVVLLVISSIVYGSCLTIGHLPIFYKTMPELASAYGASYLTNKSYGFMHTIFYILVILYYLASIGVIIYSFIRKKQVPTLVVTLIIISISISIFGFFGSRLISRKIELLPLTYNIGVVIYMVIVSRLRLYDPSDSVTDSLVEKGETGFVSLDGKLRYLGSNETAKNMIHAFSEIRIDHSIRKQIYLNENIVPFIEGYIKDEKNDRFLLNIENKIYLIVIGHLVIGRLRRGYQLLITDDTKNQEYIKLIETYNQQLEDEVAKKTAHVIMMHDNLVMAMATMVESRDNSTGGHIKRTSDCVRIFLDEILKHNELGISESFAKNIIKAAPMHDLGKIAVDDAILRKPGKYTKEEYEIMKSHPTEGARIVKQILKGTDDKDFMNVAINVAHFHHERWDGSGYPLGLKGEEIPLEARIMAIADVYDALVSKRVYKEKMSPEEANKIIMDGMGKHFDKSLEKYYVNARSPLEDYYAKIE